MRGKDPKADAQDFVKFLEGLSEEERAEGNKKEHARAEAEHKEFQEHFRADNCFLCKQPLSSFNQHTPCSHWLLKPTGFTKWNFMDIAARRSCFEIQAFLRWIANEEAFARNINDLRDEGTGKLIELTIRYKDFEWSFSCGEGDYQGHKTDSEQSQRPHYHFQMRHKKQAFIRFNDFHIPLSYHDVLMIESQRANPKLVRQNFSGGQGMSAVLNGDTVEKLVTLAKSGGAEEEAPIKIDSILMADEGTTMSGDDIANAIERAKAKGVTIASELRNIKNATLTTIVTPGPGVVEQTPRSGGRGKGKRDRD